MKNKNVHNYKKYNIMDITVLVIFCLISIFFLYVFEYSEKNKTAFKLYLYLFEREDYKVYKKVKDILQSGGIIPVKSIFTDIDKEKGIYFMPIGNYVSLWVDNKCVLSSFHKFILDELFELGNLSEEIKQVHKSDIEKEKCLKNEIKEVKEKMAEVKEKLAKLNEQDNH